jgi:cysteinyl-tRNA synthetase
VPKPILRLYNTISRSVEAFKPLKKTTVGLYTCGPTVYNFAHLGNLRTYLFEDILERTLLWSGYGVRRVMNITDVGHLTGDGDAGEDKVEKEARSERKNVKDVVNFYTKVFLADLKKLNIRIPKLLAPASKFIPEQIKLIQQLFKKGVAYDTPAAVYFDVSRFLDYGKLSGQSLEQKLSGARDEVVKDAEKRNSADFALWFKLVGRFQNHILRWPSPWGVGFPGWHIECSAISAKLLGQPFDIHTGGVDHIGTHHTNEIAQSEAAYHKPLARYWLHGEFLLVDAAKMAKSDKNFLTIKELESQNISPLAYRFLCLTAHYRSPMNFSWVGLDQARNGLINFIQRILYIDFLARSKKINIEFLNLPLYRKFSRLKLRNF